MRRIFGVDFLKLWVFFSNAEVYLKYVSQINVFFLKLRSILEVYFILTKVKKYNAKRKEENKQSTGE